MEYVFKSLLLLLIGFGNIKLLNYVTCYDESKQKSESNEEVARKRNRINNILINILSIFIVIIGIYLFSIILKELNSLGVKKLIEEGTLITANRKLIAVFSIFNGLIYGATVSLFIAKIILNKRWNSYLKYVKEKEAERFYVNIKFYKIITFVTCAGTFLLIDCYTFFGKENILINDFMGIGTKSYKYNEIISIKHIGKFHHYESKSKSNEYFTIKFDDKRKWNSMDDGFNDYKKNEILMKMIQDRSNVKIIELDYSDE
jgi:hypothetical protein